jgi:hypothetical protein
MVKTGFENIVVYKLSEELADLAWEEKTISKNFRNS